MGEDQITKLCNVYRKSKDKRERDNAYDTLLSLREIQKIISRLAKGFNIAGKNRDDLKQECLMALLAAIKVYDPQRGKFGASLQPRSNLSFTDYLQAAVRATRRHLRRAYVS